MEGERAVRKLILSTFFFASVLSGQTTYYIDPAGADEAGRNGSSGQPWLSLSYACTRVTTAGDTIHINAGNYTDNSEAVKSPGVSITGVGPTSAITTSYWNATGYHGYITMTTETYGSNGNCTLRDFKLDGNDEAGRTALMFRRYSNVKILRLTIVDFFRSAIRIETKPDSGITGIYDTGNEIAYCTITDCADSTYGGQTNIAVSGQRGILIHHNTITQTGNPLRHNGNIMSPQNNIGLKYYNNISYKPDWDGGEYYPYPEYPDSAEANNNWNFHIEQWNGRGGVEFYNNEFYGGDNPLDIAGYYERKGDSSYSVSIHHNYFAPLTSSDTTYHGKMAIDIEGPDHDEILVYCNHFKDLPTAIELIGWGTWKIHPAPHDSMSYLRRVKIRYNLFENMGWQGRKAGQWSRVFDFGSYHGNPAIMDSIWIENNTITANSYKQGTGVWASINDSTDGGGWSSILKNLFIRNNIFVDQNQSGYGWLRFYSGTGSLDSVQATNNVLYGCANNNNPYYGANLTHYSFADTLKRDPKLVSATNLHLQSTSPAINAGVNWGQTTDYEGNPIIGTPDIGAYEYQGGAPAPPSGGKGRHLRVRRPH